MFSEDSPKKKSKKVSFHHTAFIVLVPTVADYRDAGLEDSLWWNESDFNGFKSTAANDFKEWKKNNEEWIKQYYPNDHSDTKKLIKLYLQRLHNSTTDILKVNSNTNASFEPLPEKAKQDRNQNQSKLPTQQPPSPPRRYSHRLGFLSDYLHGLDPIEPEQDGEDTLSLSKTCVIS